jgi:hypothetical protein
MIHVSLFFTTRKGKHEMYLTLARRGALLLAALLVVSIAVQFFPSVQASTRRAGGARDFFPLPDAAFDGNYAALFPFGWTTYQPVASDISMRFWSPIVACDLELISSSTLRRPSTATAKATMCEPTRIDNGCCCSPISSATCSEHGRSLC